MPILKLSVAKHPTPEARERLAQRLTEVVIEELDVPPSTVNVLIELVNPAYWSVAGESLDKKIARDG